MKKVNMINLKQILFEQSDSGITYNDKKNNAEIQKIIWDVYKKITGSPEVYFRKFRTMLNDDEIAAAKWFSSDWKKHSDTLNRIYKTASEEDIFNIKMLQDLKKQIVTVMMKQGQRLTYPANFYIIKNNSYVKQTIVYEWEYFNY